MEVSLDSRGAERGAVGAYRAPLVSGKEGDPRRSGDNNRMFVEGVLWIVRTGAPWRDLPQYCRNWFSVCKRLRRWALKGGVFKRVFKKLSGEPDSSLS